MAAFPWPAALPVPTALRIKSSLPGWLHRLGVSSPATRPISLQATPGHLDHQTESGYEHGLWKQTWVQIPAPPFAQDDKNKQQQKTHPKPKSSRLPIGSFLTQSPAASPSASAPLLLRAPPPRLRCPLPEEVGLEPSPALTTQGGYHLGVGLSPTAAMGAL